MFGTVLYVGQENNKCNLWPTVCVLRTFQSLLLENHQAFYIEMIMHVMTALLSLLPFPLLF